MLILRLDLFIILCKLVVRMGEHSLLSIIFQRWSVDHVRHEVRSQLYLILCFFSLLKLFYIVCAQFFHSCRPCPLDFPFFILFILLYNHLIFGEFVDAFAQVKPNFLFM